MAGVSWECLDPKIFMEILSENGDTDGGKGISKWEQDGVNHPTASAPWGTSPEPFSSSRQGHHQISCPSSTHSHFVFILFVQWSFCRPWHSANRQGWKVELTKEQPPKLLGAMSFRNLGSQWRIKLRSLCHREQEHFFSRSSCLGKGTFFVLLILQLLILAETVITCQLHRKQMLKLTQKVYFFGSRNILKSWFTIMLEMYLLLNTVKSEFRQKILILSAVLPVWLAGSGKCSCLTRLCTCACVSVHIKDLTKQPQTSGLEWFNCCCRFPHG